MPRTPINDELSLTGILAHHRRFGPEAALRALRIYRRSVEVETLFHCFDAERPDLVARAVELLNDSEQMLAELYADIQPGGKYGPRK